MSKGMSAMLPPLGDASACRQRSILRDEIESGPEAGISAFEAERMHKKDWANWIKQNSETKASCKGGRALLISYQFPPIGGSGTQRPAKLVKYLPEFGWQIEVFAAAHGRFPWYDDSLMNDIPPECRVHRVSGYEPACLAECICSPLQKIIKVYLRARRENPHDRFADRALRWLEDRIYWRLSQLTGWFGMGNGEPLWITPAAREGVRRHRRRPFDVVISTGPPHFAHKVGMRVAQAAGLPWVADLRDPLVSDFDRIPPQHRYTKTMQSLEQAVMEHAAVVVATCPSLADDLRIRYPHRSPEDIRTITNGFDREDLKRALQTSLFCLRKSKDCVFVLAGSCYGRTDISRIVTPLQSVLDEHPQWHGRVRLVLTGTIDGEQRRYWERQHPKWMTLTGYVDHASAIRIAAKSTCAIVALPDCQHGRLAIPGKTFELMALPTHILAMVPPGSDTERIVAGAEAVTIVPFEDKARAAAAMARIISDHLSGRLTATRNWPTIDIYDRRAIAAAYADCLASVCGRAREQSNGSHSTCVSAPGTIGVEVA